MSGSGTSAVALDPTTSLPEGTICTVTVIAAEISGTDVIDPPDNMAANYVFSFTADAAPAVTTTTPTDGATNVWAVRRPHGERQRAGRRDDELVRHPLRPLHPLRIHGDGSGLPIRSARPPTWRAPRLHGTAIAASISGNGTRPADNPTANAS